MAHAHWKVMFELPEVAAATAQDSFDDFALAVSGFETNEAKKIWTFELLCQAPPDMEEVKRRLLVLASLYNVSAPVADLQPFVQKDWLAQVVTDFPPFSIGRFYVHGSHVTDIPTNALALRVNAGAAFGSGEHGTTRGCLEALDMIARQRRCQKILDMGCGSGILAIAAAKLWRTDVLAADIDPVAAQVTRDNARINGEQAYVEAIVSDGYASERVRRAGPFDLIISNILARPLVTFAPDLKRHLAVGGVAVLSGLLTSQEKQVLSAHAAQGLRLKKRIVHGEWCTLMLE